MARGARPDLSAREPRFIRRLGAITLRDREPTPAAAGFMTLLRQLWPKSH